MKRIKKLNSLLKEVISEVVTREVKNPNVSELLTITSVDVSKDLKYAKVFVSVIGKNEEKETTVRALNSASGFISTIASKKIRIRQFPSLTFKIDDTVEKQLHIDKILKDLQLENNL